MVNKFCTYPFSGSPRNECVDTGVFAEGDNMSHYNEMISIIRLHFSMHNFSHSAEICYGVTYITIYKVPQKILHS